jgi:hypothetical protein
MVLFSPFSCALFFDRSVTVAVVRTSNVVG